MGHTSSLSDDVMYGVIRERLFKKKSHYIHYVIKQIVKNRETNIR